MGREDNSIFVRNRDVEHIVNAAAGLGVYGHGEAKPKRLALLVSTDIHRCTQPLHNAVDYLNGMDALDAGLCLGDIQGANFVETDASWYYLEVNQSKKPFYTVIGNHDCGNNAKKEVAATKPEVLEKFIRTTRGPMRMPDIDKTYYAVNFDEYKVSLIVLDNYCAPEDRDENGDFIIYRGAECIDQEQVDWLVEALKAVPQGYHLLVARHGYPDSAVKVECDWTQVRGGLEGEKSPYGKSELVPDLINAWMRGDKLTKQYEPEDNYGGIVPTLRVEADFSERGEGVFISYLIGHYHRDMLAKSAVYPEQNIVSFAAGANDDWQNWGCDLPRYRNTKAEDCLTVVAVDTASRRVHLVRVGSNITLDLVDRTYTSLSY